MRNQQSDGLVSRAAGRDLARKPRPGPHWAELESGDC